MNELPAAYVDADVAYRLAVAGEEDGVAGLQLAVGDGHAVGVHIGRGAVGAVAEILVDVAHKTGTVKAAGARAGPDVGDAQVLLGEGDYGGAAAGALRGGGALSLTPSST